MLCNAFGLIYTGESNMQMRDLTYSRSVAAIPLAGRYRCIDFVLSALVNTGISNVGLIAQKNYHSLMDHLGSGKEWDLSRKKDGLFILPPFVTKENTGVYRGTVDALRSVMGYIRRSTQRYVILTGSHTVFNTTFEGMIDQHISTGADITVMYNEEAAGTAPSGELSSDLFIKLGANSRITDIQVDPYRPDSTMRSCDVFIMERTLLEFLIEEAASRAVTDFKRDVLAKKVSTLKLYGWKYDGYVGRLNSLSNYFAVNMAVLNSDVRNDLFNLDHPIYTKVKDEVAAWYGTGAKVKNSLVADGCVVEGEVEDSVLFRGVRIARGAKVKDCIIMQASEVDRDSELDHVILDKGCMIRRGRRLAGYGDFPVIVRKGSII